MEPRENKSRHLIPFAVATGAGGSAVAMGEPLYATIVAVTLALLTTGQIVLQLLLNAKLTMKQAETDQIERLIRAESDAQSALRRDEVGIIDAESRAASRATIDAARASAIANGYLAPPDTHFDPPALTH